MPSKRSDKHPDKQPSQASSRDSTGRSSRYDPQRPRQTELLFGRHAVAAALANPERSLHKLYVTSETMAAELQVPKGVAKNLPVAVGTRQDLERLLRSRGITDTVHQGVALAAEPLPDLTLDEVLEMNADNNGPLVILDQVTDPHNIGAILRSAAVFGAVALITTDRHAPHESGTLAKAASGALERVPLVRVTNLVRALEAIKQAGYWRLGLAEGGKDITTFKGDKVALVMGAEGPGLRRLTREHCDLLVALPTAGEFTTLNVSNAAAVALYAVTQN